MTCASIRPLIGLAIITTAVCCRQNSPPAVAGFREPFGAHLRSADSSIARISLGAKLFEDATLSRDSTISCATCHNPTYAFAEPRAISHGIGVRARKRNAPSLLNVAVGRRNLDWDGRATSLEDQLRGVFSIEGDMAIDVGEAVRRIRISTNYEADFLRAYGKPADVESFTNALAVFQRSLVVPESRFEKFYFTGDSSQLSASEIRGWRLFRFGNGGCAGCHTPLPEPGGPPILLFADKKAHNLGVGYEDGMMTDVGRYGVTLEPIGLGAFVTPSLRNVALTAPYMHDGSLATLEDVIKFYEQGGIKNPNLDQVMRPLTLTEQDRNDLVAFLRALTTSWLEDSALVRTRLMKSDRGAHRGTREKPR